MEKIKPVKNRKPTPYILQLAKQIMKLGLDNYDSIQINIEEASPTIITVRANYRDFITKVFVEIEEGKLREVFTDPEEEIPSS
jgi:hypothetical protein